MYYTLWCKNVPNKRCLTSIYSQASPVYGSEKCLTSIYGDYLSIYGSQTLKQNRSSNVNIFCLEHFYTIRYNTFFHTFLCSTTYQKLVFYAGIPLSFWLCNFQWKGSVCCNHDSNKINYK